MKNIEKYTTQIFKYLNKAELCFLMKLPVHLIRCPSMCVVPDKKR